MELKESIKIILKYIEKNVGCGRLDKELLQARRILKKYVGEEDGSKGSK